MSENNKENKKIVAKEISFKEANGNYILYEAKLSDLKPGTKYEYRVINKTETFFIYFPFLFVHRIYYAPFFS